MRYSLYINQPIALELGMENTTEAIIFDYLTIAPTWAIPEIIDNKVYFWVARQKICKEHEILHIQPKTVYRYFRKLHTKGLIDYKKVGKKDCIAITDLGKTYIHNTMGNLNSSPMGIIKSQKEEYKIQSNGNLKSTYKYTNPIHLSNNSLSKRGISNFDGFVSHIRANFKHKTIAISNDKYTDKLIEISVSDGGLLYDKKTSLDFQGSRAKELWNSLYKAALDGKLNLFKEETA